MIKENDISNKKILIVEDSLSFSKLVKKKIFDELEIDCDIAASFKETVMRVDNYNDAYYMGIIDLNLPDSSQGEAIDFILKKGIPVIVVTADLNEAVRDRIIKKRILDYFVKTGEQILDQMIAYIKRLSSNQSKKVLIVDDSKSSRFVLKTLLKVHKYQILEAENGKVALEILNREKDIKLVITDNVMPVMDGNELIVNIRKKYSKDSLVVIGISAYGSGLMSANYLKRGANDFITKPFVIEEFYQRINMNLEHLEFIENLRDLSVKDFLTGIYNRKYFYTTGKSKFSNYIKRGESVLIAMITIDQCKSINDDFGQDSGDKVIIKISSLLTERFPSGESITVRLDGVVFGLLFFGKNMEQITDLLESFKQEIEKEQYISKGRSFNCTVSIGLLDVKDNSFEDAVKKTDALLNQAKKSGNNQFILA